MTEGRDGCRVAGRDVGPAEPRIGARQLQTRAAKIPSALGTRPAQRGFNGRGSKTQDGKRDVRRDARCLVVNPEPREPLVAQAQSLCLSPVRPGGVARIGPVRRTLLRRRTSAPVDPKAVEIRLVYGQCGYRCGMADDIAGGSPDVVFQFDHDTSAPSAARRALAGIVDSNSFGDDVNAVASEMVSNVVRHTEDGGRMDAWDGDPFRVEVSDTSSALPVTVPATGQGGRGLRIIDALSSDWGAELRVDGKVVWAELERPSE